MSIRQAPIPVVLIACIACCALGSDWCSDSAAINPEANTSPFPFAQGTNGRLSESVSFSRFLDSTDSAYLDPTAHNIIQKGQTVVLDYIRTGQFGEFTCPDGTTIRYAVFAPPDSVPVAMVVPIIHGFAESFLGYGEMLYNLRFLRQQGFVFALADLRGQGFSGRLLDDRQPGHVDDFTDYVDDHHAFMNILRSRYGTQAPYAFYGHSLGAWIAVRYCQTYPGDIAGCVLSAPMFNVETGLPDWLEPAAMACGVLLRPNNYTIGMGPWVPWDAELHHLSDCPERIDYQNILRCFFAETRLGGATWKWIHRAVQGGREAMRPGNAKRLRGLELLIQEAPEDRFVQLEYNEKFVKYAGGTIRKYYRSGQHGQRIGASHDLPWHGDEIRGQIMEDIVKFLQGIAARNAQQ